MQKLQYLTISTILLASSHSHALKFSAQINDLRLPALLSAAQPPAIKFTAPGQMNVSSLRLCGDSDVGKFASDHPSWEHVEPDQPKLDVVMGYWVVENNSQNVVPTQANWYPIAYQKINIAEDDKDLQWRGDFLPISHNSINAGVNVLQLVGSEMINIHALAKNSFGSNKEYRVFTGAFACINPEEGAEMTPASATQTYEPTPVEMMHSLKEINAAANATFGSGNVNELIESNKKLKIELNALGDRNANYYDRTPTPYKFSFGAQGEEINSNLYAITKQILGLDYPSAASNLEEYKNVLRANSVYTTLSDLTDLTGDKIQFCNKIGIPSNKDVKSYAYEIFPMNLGCKNLYSENDLSDKFKAIFNPSSKPTSEAFTTLKKDLAKRFYVAAGYVTAQDYLNTKKVARTGCFQKNGQNLISRLVAAYPLGYKVTNGKYLLQPNKDNHVHPESLFAIHDFDKYWSNDKMAVWGQVTVDKDNLDLNNIQNDAIYLPLGRKGDLESSKVERSSFNVPINIRFKTRTVGGSCPPFC